MNLGCHGIPDRCFNYKGSPMPICARCLGGNIGQAVSLILFIFKFLPGVLISFLLVAIMVIDWALQTYFGVMSNNYRRLMTGILGGIGSGALIWYAVLFLYIFVNKKGI